MEKYRNPSYGAKKKRIIGEAGSPSFKAGSFYYIVYMTLFDQPIFVLALLCAMIWLSLLAAKTKWGKPLGAALLVILFTAVLANAKIIPSASDSIPLYDGIFHYVAPLSIFYLLLGANLREIKKVGLPVLALFLMGSLATVIGILGAWVLVSPQTVLGENAKILAGMLTGTYTGGSANFNAVALIYNFQEEGLLYAGAIAVDNVVTALWIMITIAMPKMLRRWFKDRQLSVKSANDEQASAELLDLFSLSSILVLGLVALFFSEYLNSLFPKMPSILIISTLGILMAQVPFIQKLKGAHTLGLYTVYLFLAVIGAYCEIGAVMELKEMGWTLLSFTSLAVFIHGLVIVGLGGLFFRDWDMVAIASQANIGGGASAIALAETFERNELIFPAILVGTLGTALGSYLGFLVVNLL